MSRGAGTRRWSLLILLFGVLKIGVATTVPSTTTTTKTICPSQVPDAISAILANCSYCARAHVGIRVDMLENNGTWTTLFSQNSNSFMLPASNNKLFTTAAAFYELGLNYTIRTPVYLSVDGDLCVVGRGDPSITNSDLLTLAGSMSKEIKEVRNVYIDDAYYQGPLLPQNWEWSDVIQAWGAIPAPLILDENAYNFNIYSTNVGDYVTLNFSYAVDASMFEMNIEATTSESDIPAQINFDIRPSEPTRITVTGTVPYGSGANPFSLAAINTEARFGSLFAQALTSQQVKITGEVAAVSCGELVEEGRSGWKLVGSIISPPLSEMMNYTLQVSDNIYAETFLSHVGKAQVFNETATTRAQGINGVRTILVEKYGLENGSFVQDDGSGVSRHNMASADALISVIEAVYFDKDGDIYLSFLPVAGVSGTLADRYINTPAQGILHAKTGTLDGVNCLTGFIDHHNSDFPIITFSMLMNMGTSSFIPPVDKMGVLLSTVKNC